MDNDNYKQLIYVFYVYKNIKTIEDVKNNIIYKIHVANLKKIYSIFDNITFIISLDDLSQKKLIYDIKEFFTDIFKDKKVNFIVEQNIPEEREGHCFYKYVICNFENLHGNVFYAHSKGITNIENGLDTALWIISMYYFNFLELPEKYINENTGFLTFGFPFDNFIINEWIRNFCFYINPEYCNMYSGTFYWFNPQKIIQYLKDNNKLYLLDYLKKDTPLRHEFISENFLIHILPYSKLGAIYKEKFDQLVKNLPNSLNEHVYNFYNPADLALYITNFYADKVDEFVKYKNEIISEIHKKEEDQT